MRMRAKRDQHIILQLFYRIMLKSHKRPWSCSPFFCLIPPTHLHLLPFSSSPPFLSQPPSPPPPLIRPQLCFHALCSGWKREKNLSYSVGPKNFFYPHYIAILGAQVLLGKDERYTVSRNPCLINWRRATLSLTHWSKYRLIAISRNFD